MSLASSRAPWRWLWRWLRTWLQARRWLWRWPRVAVEMAARSLRSWLSRLLRSCLQKDWHVRWLQICKGEEWATYMYHSTGTLTGSADRAAHTAAFSVVKTTLRVGVDLERGVSLCSSWGEEGGGQQLSTLVGEHGRVWNRLVYCRSCSNNEHFISKPGLIWTSRGTPRQNDALKDRREAHLPSADSKRQLSIISIVFQQTQAVLIPSILCSNLPLVCNTTNPQLQDTESGWLYRYWGPLAILYDVWTRTA